MSVNNEPLVLDLLEWMNPAPRRYEEVMSAWRTSCPRLTIWEDALDAGFLTVRDRQVFLTAAGCEFLKSRRRRQEGERISAIGGAPAEPELAVHAEQRGA
jgi:hypothetical protein